MPYVKPISGHTTTANIRRYLTKDGRALAADYLNMEYDSIIQGTEARFPVSYDWARDMDATREALGTNAPWNGLCARSFLHYILSPDPEDKIGLGVLGGLAVQWASENYAGFQVAIVYHDDNENRIPHAHIVVNNVNLKTGRRLQDATPRERLVSAQDIAKARGLSHFEPNTVRRDGFQKMAAVSNRRGTPQQSRQRVYVGRAEASLREAGKYSWVADIRDRVSIARSIAPDEAEFKSALEAMGVNVTDNSPKCSGMTHPARFVPITPLGICR